MDVRVFSIGALRSQVIQHHLLLGLVVFDLFHQLLPLLVVVHYLLLVKP